VLTLSVLQGLSVLVAVAAVYLWAVLGDRDDATVRSITFATLVLSNLLLIVVNRSWRLPVWRLVVERRNPTLKWIVALGAGLLGLLLGVPGLRHVFGLGPVRLLDLAVAVAAAVLGVVWFEVYKVRRGDLSGRLSRSG
jgi:Ca2+-transporting ATPase